MPGWAVLCGVATAAAAAGFSKQPHLVFMLGDEIGWNNVGWHSNITLTPHMTALARGGITLDRHCVMTGRYPYNVGLNEYSHGVEEERSAVPAAFAMLPKLLKSVGYRTHQLGKWHLGFFSSAHVPVGRGFDSSFGFLCGESTHDTRGSQVSHTCKISVTDLYNSTHFANTSAWAYNHWYNTDMYSTLAAELIHDHVDKHANAPFYLYMAFQNAHAPYQAPPHLLARYPNLPPNKSQQCFNAMVSGVDDVVGVIVEALKTSGMYSNTIIVYSSDNGGPARMSNNLPLRGAKFGLFEGSFRVPAFVHSALLPTRVIGTTSEATVHAADWYVTLAALAGVPNNVVQGGSGPVPPDGIDVWDAVTTPGTPSPRTMIVHEYDEIQGIFAVRAAQWKLIWGKLGDTDWIADISYDQGCTTLLPPINMSTDNSGDAMVRGDEAESQSSISDSSLTCTADRPCLFDVISDPYEHANPLATAKANPGVVRRLQQELTQYVSTRYMGGLDKAVTSEDDYCAIIKRDHWVYPYDDGAKPPGPMPPAVAGVLNGTWCQGCASADGPKPIVHEMMSVAVSVNGEVSIRALNCSGCCWTSAAGSVTVSSGGTPTLVVRTAGGCSKQETGDLRALSVDTSWEIVWGSWKTWVKA